MKKKFKIVIGDQITLTILEVIGNRVKVGIEAPGQVRVLRGELACWDDSPTPAPKAKALARR